MKKLFIATALLAFFTASCEKEENETNISYHNTSKSHNTGVNCMNCHKSGGEGEGIFQAAGSVYDSLLASPYANATIKLYTGPNGTGTLKATIDGDLLGNFFTTNTIDFSTPLYPAVAGSTTIKYMSTPITTGACYSCHSVTTSRIWTK